LQHVEQLQRGARIAIAVSLQPAKRRLGRHGPCLGGQQVPGGFERRLGSRRRKCVEALGEHVAQRLAHTLGRFERRERAQKSNAAGDVVRGEPLGLFRSPNKQLLSIGG
jgi:hypothetical protein